MKQKLRLFKTEKNIEVTQLIHISGIIRVIHISLWTLLFRRFDTEEGSRKLLRNVGNFFITSIQ
jgi:hypothetical protein